MFKLSSPVLSSIAFIMSLLSYVGLQFAPHVDPSAVHNLYIIMGLTLGHALGTRAASGTTAVINLPEGTSTTSKTGGAP